MNHDQNRRGRLSRTLPPIGAFALAVTIAGSAEANGRFPRAQRLLERPENADELVLAATYGLLVTSDRGETWRHLCEVGYAFTIEDLDPIVERTGDGALLATAAHSLNRAAPPFCDFEAVLGGAGTQTVVDHSLDRADRSRVLAVLMESGEAGLTNRVFESTDAGRTFAPRGAPLPMPDIAFAITFDVAPSDPARFYVSATSRTSPQALVRSDDGGASWTTISLPLAGEEYPYLAAVHPTNPDVVYLRTDHWALSDDGILEASDALFVSEDGGATFRELYRAGAKLFGFALSPDASELVVGYGDPVDPSRLVDETALGIYRASTADHAFTKIFDGPVSCLTWTERGLYACTSQADRGFALGFAPNADFDLDTPEPFEPLLDLGRVAPLDCPACTTGAACRERWPESCAVFGNCDAGVGAAAGSGGADCGGAAGSGGRPFAGAGGRAGAAGAKGARDATSSTSCGCRQARQQGGAAEWLWLALFVAGTFRRGRGGGRRIRATRNS